MDAELALLEQGDSFDQQPHQALALPRRGVGILPETGKVLGQGAEAQKGGHARPVKKITKAEGQPGMNYMLDVGLPLALLWVQGQIAVLGYSVTQVLDKLSLDADIPILQYCFNHSWNLLRHNNEKKLLFIMALHPEAVSREALKEIAGIDDEDQFESAIQISHKGG